MSLFRKLTEKAGYWNRYARRNAFVLGRSASLKRILNFFLIELQQRIFAERVIGRPWSLFIDPANLCVLRCPLCGTGRGDLPRKQAHLSFDDFVRYLGPLADTLYIVKLYNYGEPLLNQDLPAMIHWCAERRIATQVNTNLNVCTQAQAQEIVATGLDRLVVSFDGMAQESYAAYRRHGSLETVLRNMGFFTEAKKEQDSETPAIVLQYLITRHNEKDYRQIQEYARSIDAEFFPQPITLDPKNPEQVREWLPQNEEFTYYDRQKGIKKKTRPDRHCGFLWNDIVINVDGGVSPCCHLFYESTDFGNLNKEPFSKIWNNEKFRQARRIFRDRTIESSGTACSRCVDVRAFGSMEYDLVNENRTNELGKP